MILADRQDAQGHAILECAKGGRDVFEVIEREDGYVDATNVETYLAPYLEWPRRQRIAIRYARGRVLDVGCGGGRHSLYLQRMGHDVLGVDVSPNALRASKLRGLKNTRLASITDLDSKYGIFDTILMLGNNFGLFSNPRKARRLLRTFATMSNEKGRIISESLDVHRNPNPSHLRYQRLNITRGRMPGQVRIRVRYRDYMTPWFDYLLVSKSEMEEIVRATPWTIARFIESKNGPEYVAVLEKK